MVRNEYGKTTWGKAFLDALGRLDTNKRLARGKSYANTGKVLSISVQGSKVTAKVQGNYGVYDVLVKFQDFSVKQKETVFAIVEQSPILLAHILNGELPDELLVALDKASVSLLPISWYEIHGRCTCPDDGNPCKHMAAVYFLVTSEIDKNPFTLFLLRGVDLKQYFNVKNSEIEPSYPLPVTALTAAAKVEKELQNSCELVKIPSMADFILDCLSPNPAFSSQLDYKDVMMEFYRFAAKKSSQVIASFAKGDPFDSIDADLFQRVWSNSSFQLRLSENFSTSTLWIKNEVFNSGLDLDDLLSTIPKSVQFINGEETTERIVVMDMFTAFQVFLRCTSDFGTSSYRYFYYAFRVALLLINSQAFVPDLLPISYAQANGKIASFKIIWKPLFSCSIVAEQLNNLNNVFPPQTEEWNFESVARLGEKSLDGNSGTLHILTALLTNLIKKLEFCHKKLKNNPPKESQAFFFGQVFHIISLAEHNIPKAITKYFGVFDLMKTDFKVAIRIKKDSCDFAIGVPSAIEETFKIGLWLNKSGASACEAVSLRNYLKSFPSDRNQVLKFLSTLSPYLNNVEQFLMRDEIPLSSGDLEIVLLQTAKLFANLGVQIVLPRELRKTLKPRAVVRTRSKSSLDENQTQKSFLKLDQLLCYDWMICIGEEKITVAEFHALVQNGKQLFKYKDKYVAITADEMKNILSSVNKQPPILSGLDLLKETLRENSMFMMDSDVDNFIKSKLNVTNHVVPNLNCTLREYQVKGFRWLVSNMINGFGCILADDMGLGKTVQMIAAIAFLKSQGILKHTTLLVVPSSLVSNWNREIRRFSPSLTVSTYYGAGRQIGLDETDTRPALLPVKPEILDQEATMETASGVNTLCITKSESKRPHSPDVEKNAKRAKRKPTETNDIILTTYSLIWRDLTDLKKKQFGLICIDEAQYIKNSKSQTSQALKKLKAPMRVALSGTPVENNLSELWSVFDFVLPKYLGTLKDFKGCYARAIEVRCDKQKLDDLKLISSPFLLRRLKTDPKVIKDLPLKIVDNKYTVLTPQQAALYEGVVQNITQKIADSDGIQRKGLIFKLLTALKQICNHPANFNEDSDIDPDISGKTKLLLELLDPILKAGEKVLIFSQYVKMIHLLEKIIEKNLHVKPLIFEGSLSQKKRDSVIYEFQNYPYRQIFIISLKAGGVGLNLTAANHVIHYDLWYNPAVENQATDRAFRIGQTKNVFVHRLITQNTFEEKIDEMLKQKQSLSDMSISVKESWITELSNEELKKLFIRTPRA